MDRSRLELEPGIWLDARRAVWLENERALAVADLHLGYAWAHRHDGNLLPVSAREDSVERLLALVESYRPQELILLGDVVHRALLVPALKEELCALFTKLEDLTRLRLVLGNHDVDIARLLRECDLQAPLDRALRIGPHTLVHGDEKDAAAAKACLDQAAANSGRVIIGHEHPAISIGDGVSSRVRCPCFAVGPELLILPAFTAWSAGTELRASAGLSAFSRHAPPDRAVAIVAGKLLPMRL